VTTRWSRLHGCHYTSYITKLLKWMTTPFEACNLQRSNPGFQYHSRHALRLFSVCVARGLATGRFHSRGVLPHFRKQIAKCIIWEVVRCLLLLSNPSAISGMHVQLTGRLQWPRGLRRGSAAARLLRLWVRILPGAWMFVLSAVRFQGEVSAKTWSFVQRVVPTVVRCCTGSRNLTN
jgi:hypothetical protein